MRDRILTLGAAAAALATTLAAAPAASAQTRTTRGDGAPRVERPVRAVAAVERIPAPAVDPLTALGITAAPSGGGRDTLGLLIATVTPGGPADRAGVDAGSRLAEINGVSLRSNDGGEGAADDAWRTRVVRALRTTQAGGEVALRLYRAGRFRTVSIAAPASVTAAVPAPAAAPAEPHLTLAPELPARVPHVEAPIAVAAPAASAVAATVSSTASSSASTLVNVIEATTQAQAQLGRLVMQEEASDGPMLDSLAQLQQDFRALQRRLRTLQARAQKSPAAHAATDVAAAPADVPLDGLKLGAVSDELVAYYGEGSDAGLLVLQADAAWSPLHAGDVILRVEGAAPTPALLRAASESKTPTRIDVLRRRRTITVTLPPRE